MPERRERATRNKEAAYTGSAVGSELYGWARHRNRATVFSPEGFVDGEEITPRRDNSVMASKRKIYPDYNDVTSEALSTFKLIEKNRPSKKTLGRADMKFMPCTCSAKYVEGINIACSGDGCINRECRIECVGRKTKCGKDCQNRHFVGKNRVALDVIRLEFKGYGIRARRYIAEGHFILEYKGDIITHEEMIERTKMYELAGNKHFYFMELKAGQYIDAARQGSLGRFVNHSCKPNSEIQKWDVDGELRMGLFALEDIYENEEVTFDYRAVTSGSEVQTCYCGEEGCIEVLGRQRQRITVTAQKSGQSHSGIVLSPDASRSTRSKPTSRAPPPAPVAKPPRLVMSSWFGHVFPIPQAQGRESVQSIASPEEGGQDASATSSDGLTPKFSEEPFFEKNDVNYHPQDSELPSSPPIAPELESDGNIDDGEGDREFGPRHGRSQVPESINYDDIDIDSERPSDESDVEIVDVQEVPNEFKKEGRETELDRSFEMEIDSVELSPTFVQALDLSSNQVQTLVDELLHLKVSEGIYGDEELLERYAYKIPINDLPESSVGKVMRTLMHSPQVVLAKLILRRIYQSDKPGINFQVMRLHGYQIFERILREAEKFGDEIVLMIFEIMERWPRLSKNKISASDIESVTTHIRDTTKSTEVRSHATLLCEEWSKLQKRYRIPKKQSALATHDNSGYSCDEDEDIPSSSVIVQQVLHDDSSDDSNGPLQDSYFAPVSQHTTLVNRPEQYEISSDSSGEASNGKHWKHISSGSDSDDNYDYTMARLPKGWKSNTAKGGHVYYYNEELDIRQWHRPGTDPDAKPNNANAAQRSQPTANDTDASQDNRSEKRERGGDDQKQQNGANKRRRADRSSSAGSNKNNKNNSNNRRDGRRRNGKEKSNEEGGHGQQHASSVNESVSGDDRSAEIQRIIYNASKEKPPQEPSETKSETPSKPEDLRSILTKSFARYVPNVVSRYEKELGRDNCKRFSKDIVKVLVEKELRPDHHIRHPEHLSDEKKEKVKGFVKSYMKKALEKYRQKRKERHGSAEVRSGDLSRDQGMRSSSVEVDAVTKAVTEDVAAEISSAMLNAIDTSDSKNEKDQSRSWNDGTAEIDLEDD